MLFLNLQLEVRLIDELKLDVVHSHRFSGRKESFIPCEAHRKSRIKTREARVMSFIKAPEAHREPCIKARYLKMSLLSPKMPSNKLVW